ncbi:MAG: hypothetical protein ACHP7D_10170 [Lysobacterales bacterium]
MHAPASPPVPAYAAPRFAVLAGVGLILVALLGFAHVPYPFDVDQGLFTYYARAMAHGARLYIDFWDLKQPGIYWYYEIAGSLLGFNEIGIHSFDLVWMLVLAGVLLWIAAREFSVPLLAALAPLICLGPFYAKAEPIHLAQVEGVVGLPIAVVLALLLDTSTDSTRHAFRFAATGALLVVVAAFKLILVPIPAAMIALVLLQDWRTRRVPFRDVLRHGALPVVVGAAGAAAVLAIWLWHAGILEQTLWVAFTYPPLAIREYDRQPVQVLIDSAAWFWSAERFLLPFALLGIWREIVVRHSRIGWFALLWLVVGAALLVAQVLSWGQYHFNLLFVPVGLLAVAGVQALCELGSTGEHRRRIARLACALILGLGVAVSVVHKLQRYWLAGASPFRDPMAFMIRVEPRMQAVADGAALLARPDARPGKIADLGDPRMFLYANRPTLLSINGYAYMLASQWREAVADLDRQRPAYIYLGNGTRYIWAHGTDAVERLLAAHYVLRLHDMHDGEWYELRDDGTAIASGANP